MAASSDVFYARALAAADDGGPLADARAVADALVRSYGGDVVEPELVG